MPSHGASISSTPATWAPLYGTSHVLPQFLAQGLPSGIPGAQEAQATAGPGTGSGTQQQVLCKHVWVTGSVT